MEYGSESAVSTTKELSTPIVQKVGKQTGLYVENVSKEPVSFVLKIINVPEGNWDLYINQKYIGVKNNSQLADGLKFEIHGFSVDEHIFKMLEILEKPVEEAYEKFSKSKDEEELRYSYTLSQVQEWISSAFSNEKVSRSVEVMINPEGLPLQPMDWYIRVSKEEAIESVVNAAWLIQQARARMYEVLKNRELSNYAVQVLTPVEFSYKIKSNENSNSILLSLTSYCNLPLNGIFEISAPAGWKLGVADLRINNLQFGETKKLEIPIKKINPNAEIPKNISAKANLTIVQNEFTAKVVFDAKAIVE
ncbi:MAG: hypothetical protein SNJ70_05030 [Armatimonadota bacterium]